MAACGTVPRIYPGGKTMTAAQAENFIYQDQLVTITNARAILGGTTYAVRNITSVRHTKEPGPMWLVLFALSVALLGGALLDVVPTIGVPLALLGALGAIVAFILRKPKHWVSIGTAGAEFRAIFSYDPAWTTTVVDALNNAIISRG